MDVSSADPDPEPGIIVARPYKAYWWLVLFGVAIGLLGAAACLFDTSPNPAPVGMGLFCLLSYSIPAIVGAWAMIRGHVIADETGVRWRTLGRERRVSWSQITHVCHSRVQKNQIANVQTEGGSFTLTKSYTNHEALQKAIEERATSAQIRLKTPQLSTLAPGERKTFLPNTGFARWFWPIFALAQLPVLAACYAFSRPFTPEDGWHWGLGGLFLGAMGGVFGLVAGMDLPTLRAIRARRGERITVSAQGISWEHGFRIVEARWDEILAYRARSERGGLFSGSAREVETARGTFTFEMSAYRGGGKLERLILRYLPDEDRIDFTAHIDGKATSLPDGSCWYSYRNMGSWMFLAVYTLYDVIIPLAMVAVWLSDISGGEGGTASNPLPVLGAAILALPPLIYLSTCYRHSGICVTREGIEHRTRGHSRRFAWSELRRVRQDGLGRLIFETTRGRFTATALLGDRKALLTQVAQFAPHVALENTEKLTEKSSAEESASSPSSLRRKPLSQ